MSELNSFPPAMMSCVGSEVT